MARRGRKALGQRRTWVMDLALATHHAFPEAPHDRPRELAVFLGACSPLQKAFRRARQRGQPVPTVKHTFFSQTAMGTSRWPVAPLATVRDLKDLLGLDQDDLRWFADSKGLERTVRDERLRHYRYRWLPKPSGGTRLIEEPKPLLKHFQRVLLRQVLDHVPPHNAAHGFRQGRSALSYVDNHTGRAVVVHMDLEDFFGTISSGRVYGIFKACGYPEDVAYMLTALATNTVPASVWARAPHPSRPELIVAHYRLGRHLASPHLPQGAPTSPALANLAAFGLDRRLSALSASFGMRYSRYADDLALSSACHLSGPEVDRLTVLVTQIAKGEGFRVNQTKLSVQHRGQRQQLAGLVVNDRPNIDRREYDLLKATLHNAARLGPESQNRRGLSNYRAHLLGRVSRVHEVNPRRGERLLATFAEIRWPVPSAITNPNRTI